MYIITNNNNVIIAISNTYRLDEEHRNIILDEYNIAYGPNEVMNAFEVQEVPSEVEVEKYCYTEAQGFYKNPDYKQYYSIEDRVEALEQMMNEMILGEE